VWRLTLAAALALTLVFALVGPVAAAEPPTCFGLRPTRVGTPGNDRFWGTAGNDVIMGRGGNDTVRPSDGADVLCGGPGADRLFGGDGTDRLDGGFGADLLESGNGGDRLKGGPGGDVCYQDAGDGWRSECERQRYVFPLSPVGGASYGAFHHDYPATDMFTAVGTRFRAVTSGIVQELSRTDRWDSGVDDPATRSGLFVAIIGDDCVRYHGSHLSSVVKGLRPGDHVWPGMKLGLSGRSGNARFTRPHLHFGISRPTWPGDWAVRRGQIGPYPYLTSWESGGRRSPRDAVNWTAGACAWWTPRP
jgi:Ca2+-binding RTX toxin-like protein